MKLKCAFRICLVVAITVSFSEAWATDSLRGIEDSRKSDDEKLREVEKLIGLPLSHTAQQIIGIKEITSYLKGTTSLEGAKELMKKNTRNFAKRQMTWFRRNSRIQRKKQRPLSKISVQPLLCSDQSRLGNG